MNRACRRFSARVVATFFITSFASLPSQASDSAADLGAAVRGVLGAAHIAGQSTLRWLGMRVYDATLWIPASAPQPQAPGASASAAMSAPFDREFVLELRYAMSLAGQRIAERSDVEMARLPERADAAQRAAWLAQMKTLFPDVRSGDRLAGAYRPGGPTRFWLNDRPLGDVSDPAFGPAFFGIWLDARSSEPAMRAALLRGVAPAGLLSSGDAGAGAPAGTR